MPPSSFVKDPDATLDYQFDWAAWLVDGDTISAHDIAVTPAGPTVVTSSHTGGTAVVVRLSGGTVDTEYEVRCRITATSGQIDDRTFKLYVRER